jgi:CrcB protein
MIERRQFALAGGYAAASVVLSVAALFAGLMIARRALGAAL